MTSLASPPSKPRAEYFRRYVPVEVSSEEVARSNTIYLCLSGSTLLGLNHALSDRDEMGIFIEPIDFVVGFKSMEHWQGSTSGQNQRSLQGDVDTTIYSLRKYLSLAMQGNPSILPLLFVDGESDTVLLQTEYGRELVSLRDAFISKRAIPRYKGYLRSQADRFLHGDKGHTPSRPELIEQFGYDTKYAMHAIRLGIQGLQLMGRGTLDIPLTGWENEFLRDIRQGKFTFEEVVEAIDHLEQCLARAEIKCELPDEPDVARITEFSAWAHTDFWNNA